MNFVEHMIGNMIFGGGSSSGSGANIDISNAKNEVMLVTALDNIVKGQLVYYTNIQPNSVKIADGTNQATILVAGIATHDAFIGSPLSIQKDGEFFLDSWNLEYPKLFYLGTNGNITDQVPDVGFIYKVGNSTKPNSIVLDLDQNPIKIMA